MVAKNDKNTRVSQISLSNLAGAPKKTRRAGKNNNQRIRELWGRLTPIVASPYRHPDLIFVNFDMACVPSFVELLSRLDVGILFDYLKGECREDGHRHRRRHQHQGSGPTEMTGG